MDDVTSGKLRVLELYSGIGGMHCALEESGLAFEVVAAIDINNVANDIYRHNFPTTKLLQRVIESVGLSELDRLRPDMITMSPPCQPFTRVGLQKDKHDQRTKSFFHILDLLPQLTKLPSYILVENVKGFDTSETKAELVDTLENCGYQIQEFLITPNQFGIPNSRLRYYLLAKRKGLTFSFPTKPGVRWDIPDCMEPFLIHKVHLDQKDSCSGSDKGGHTPVRTHDDSEQASHMTSHGQSSEQSTNDSCLATGTNCENPKPQVVKTDTEAGGMEDSASLLNFRECYQNICQPISEYMEKEPEEFVDSCLLEEKWFRRFWCMDIVQESARNCCCFTKGYGHHIEGAGSILQMAPHASVNLNVYKEKRTVDNTTHETVRALRLRFFSPREVANIMCFPSNFSFPDQMSARQCYRVLGNSLNVHVVSILVRLLSLGDDLSQIQH